MPILELQKMATLPTIGKIRLGYSEPGNNGGKKPKKSDKWILTSPRRNLLEAAAEMYGGTVTEWGEQFRLFTNVAEIRVYVTPIEASQWLELWDGEECLRRCDSETCYISNPQGGKRRPTACICEIEEHRKCKPTSRYSFLIPELPELGIWLYESKGFHNAIEMPKMLDFVRVAGQLVVEAFLAIEIRRKKVRGQIAKFPVAVVRVKKRPEAALMGRTSTPAALGEQAKALLSSYGERGDIVYGDRSEAAHTLAFDENAERVHAELVEEEGEGLGMDR